MSWNIRERMTRHIQHPLTRGVHIDDPRNTLLRRHIVQEKAFLRRIYCEWYEAISRSLVERDGSLLEIGSGPGFIKQFLPQVITSEVFPVDGVERIEDAHNLSFPDSSLNAIIMTDVLHHIPDLRAFFLEASRTLKPGGQILMIEPWRTSWSTFVYQRLHHEPFDEGAIKWELPPGGPLSAANGALPWIIFNRDRQRFEQDFPTFLIQKVQPMMPFTYLASGGLSTKFDLPEIMYPWIRSFEKRLLRERGAMFALIEVTKRK